MPPLKHVGCVRNFIVSGFKWRRVIKKYGSSKNKQVIIKERKANGVCVWSGWGGGVGRESQQELLCQIFRRIKSL